MANLPAYCIIREIMEFNIPLGEISPTQLSRVRRRKKKPQNEDQGASFQMRLGLNTQTSSALGVAGE